MASTNSDIALALLRGPPADPKTEEIFEKFIRALQKHAQAMGYRLEAFRSLDFRDGAEVSQLLHSKGFQGVILPSLIPPQFISNFDWSLFPVVSWGGPLHDSSADHEPIISCAAVDHFRAVRQAWTETWKRGYRRIGFAFLTLSETIIDDQLRVGAANYCLQQAPAKDRIPILIPPPNSALDTATVSDWVRTHKLDAVIGFNDYIRWALEHEGFRVPNDIGFVTLHRLQGLESFQIPEDPSAGMKLMKLECMKAALELLDQQIRLRQNGLPIQSQVVTICSKWTDGDSLLAKPIDPSAV